MSEANRTFNLEQLKDALAAEGRAMSAEQLQALSELVALLGGVPLARAAVELLADLQDAA